MAKRKRVSRDVWTQRVERWRRSGQSMTAFASEIGVHPKTLSYWRWKLERESSKDVELHATTVSDRSISVSPLSTSFVEFVAPVASSAAERLEVILRNGVRVIVPLGFESAALQRLIDVVGQR